MGCCTNVPWIRPRCPPAGTAIVTRAPAHERATADWPLYPTRREPNLPYPAGTQPSWVGTCRKGYSKEVGTDRGAVTQAPTQGWFLHCMRSACNGPTSGRDVSRGDGGLPYLAILCVRSRDSRQQCAKLGKTLCQKAAAEFSVVLCTHCTRSAEIPHNSWWECAIH